MEKLLDFRIILLILAVGVGFMAIKKFTQKGRPAAAKVGSWKIEADQVRRSTVTIARENPNAPRLLRAGKLRACFKKKRCFEAYKQYKQEALDLNIKLGWQINEAERLGIEFDPERLREVPVLISKRHLTKEDQRNLSLYKRLQIQLSAHNTPRVKLNKAALKAQYDQAKPPQIPEKRTVSAFSMIGLKKAQVVKSRIASGMSFQAAARKYGDDPTYSFSSGNLGEMIYNPESKLSKIAFSLKDRGLKGPVKIDGYYFLVRLEDIEPAHQGPPFIPFEQAYKALKYQKEDKLIQQEQQGYRKRWSEQTVCSPGFQSELCGGRE